MTEKLLARFEKQYQSGVKVQVDFSQPADSFNVTVLLGSSGSGKTTLLRCLAGLTEPTSGVIQFGRDTWFSAEQRISMSPQRRDIGYLFQDYALFPHLNVAENIEYGLRNQPGPVRQARREEMMTLFELQGLERRRPHELSGGQQQRVALARAIARRPRLLLLDEPLSSLDSPLREQLRGELRRLLAKLNSPVVIVTHDRMEAIMLADRVAVMNDGRIEQLGSVQEVFNRPRNAQLARLVGMETIVSGEIVEIHDGLATVQVGPVQLLAVAPPEATRSVDVCIKGEDVALQIDAGGLTSVRNHLAAKITSLQPEGPLVRIGLDCGFALTSLVTRPACAELNLQIGSSVVAMLKAPAIHLIPRA